MKIKSIAIETTNKAFLPESFAYRDYFRKHGYICDFVEKGNPEILDYDASFIFHGFHPFWKKYSKFVVGEYHSLSTGRFSRVKDFIKRIFNVRPNLYVFLNEELRNKMWFSSNINYITRSMGYDEENCRELEGYCKKFDIVYCGSFREGLLTYIIKLANMGFSIVVVGFDSKITHKNIKFLGRKSPEDAKSIIFQAKYGLNYTPNIFPLNIQDSTKVIEYCALGLGVITNRYQWINEFEKLRLGQFLSLDKVNRIEDVHNFTFIIPDVSDLDWRVILKNTHLIKKIENFL
jgi:hypothetical protein